MRRIIVRYAVLSNVIVLRQISNKVALRFPTLQHLVDAKLMTPTELEQLEALAARTENAHDLSWAPIQWAAEVVREADNQEIGTKLTE